MALTFLTPREWIDPLLQRPFLGIALNYTPLLCAAWIFEDFQDMPRDHQYFFLIILNVFNLFFVSYATIRNLRQQIDSDSPYNRLLIASFIAFLAWPVILILLIFPFVCVWVNVLCLVYSSIIDQHVSDVAIENLLIALIAALVWMAFLLIYIRHEWRLLDRKYYDFSFTEKTRFKVGWRELIHNAKEVCRFKHLPAITWGYLLLFLAHCIFFGPLFGFFQHYQKQHPLISEAIENGNVERVEEYVNRWKNTSRADREFDKWFHQAVALGNADAAKLFLDHGANLNSIVDDADAMSEAILSHSPEMVRSLFDWGYDINWTNRVRLPHIYLLTYVGQDDEDTSKILQILLQHGARLDQPFRKAVNPLHYALHMSIPRAEKMALALLKAGAPIDISVIDFSRVVKGLPNPWDQDVLFQLIPYLGGPNQLDGSGYGWLHRLATMQSKRYARTAEKLLNIGANIDLVSSGVASLTPLEMAIIHQNHDWIEWLLEHGADPNFRRDEYDPTAILEAAANGDIAVMQQLIDHGASLTQKWRTENDKCLYPIHMAAAQSGSVEAIEFLLSHGAELNMQDDYQCPPLSMAACNGHPVIAEYLIERGAAVDLADPWGHTALYWAANIEDPEVMKVLLEHGADPDQQTPKKQPLVFYALENCDVRILELLIQHGADVCVEYDGMTLLEAAKLWEYDEEAQVIEEALKQQTAKPSVQ
ncbi:ankyrin repeat domain-containing protein [Candidatus Sumerlaeota bacterium]|nr:ankyrin repeat domain-containing protein [Candidatus Sumerlaeota bacterium]